MIKSPIPIRHWTIMADNSIRMPTPLRETWNSPLDNPAWRLFGSPQATVSKHRNLIRGGTGLELLSVPIESTPNTAEPW